MNYEQKYKDALEKAKIIYYDHHKDKRWQYWLLTRLFPELKEDESEDERIRKAIIAYISHDQHCGVSNADMITWLEKQKEPEDKDERIRKVIHGWICIQPSQFFDDGFSKEEMLDWVENQSKTFNVELLTKVLTKHLYTCVNKTNTYVRSEEDHITLTELIAKIKADLNIK